MNLDEVVRRALSDLIPEGEKWLVALSGGADSVAALRILLDVVRDSGGSLSAAHLDHRLRDDSGADAAFVAELCESLGVPFKSVSVDVRQVALDRRWNLEEAARRIRYSFLHAAARELGADGIVVAHTRDDQAETFLRQALRGSAFPVGMPARRGIVVRPLLQVSRSALREYLRGLPQAWREDPSNLDVELQERAWLRHSVLPLLRERYPHASANLARTATGLADVRDAIDQVAKRLFGTGSLNVTALAGAPAALQRAALAGLVRASGFEPGFGLIEDARAALQRSGTPWRRSLGRGKTLRLAYGRLEVVGVNESALTEPLSLDTPDAVLEAARGFGVEAEELPDVGVLEALIAERGPLTLRHRLDGDRVRLRGGSKLVSDLLIDLKVPREERDALLLLASGPDVVWLEGLEVGAPSGRHSDNHWMRLALEQAELAEAAGELPVGAVVVRDGEVLAAAHNLSRSRADATAHAEVLALRAAGEAAGDWRLTGATLYVTLEPCPMCLGAVLQTQLARVVFGAENVREGALGSVVDLRTGPWKRVPDVAGGVLAAQSSKLLSSFFLARRAQARYAADEPES